MAEHVKAGTLAAGATVSAIAPRVSVKTGAVAAAVRVSAPAPTLVILGGLSASLITACPHCGAGGHRSPTSRRRTHVRKGLAPVQPETAGGIRKPRSASDRTKP